MRRLLIRPGAIGDFIVSLPALEYLRAAYTEVWAASANLPLARFAHRARSIASTGLDLLELGQAPSSLLETLSGFDDIVSWYGSSRPEFRLAVADLPFRFYSALPDGVHSASDFYLQQVGASLGSPPRIAVPERPRSFLAIHPYSGSPSKNWLRFGELVRALPPDIPAELCAYGEHQHRFDDLYDLACWLAGARLYLGNDSGITHLAAATGTPVLALFGPTDPRVWAPPGARVIHRPVLHALSVEEVRAAVIDCW
ncbi:MAG: glycosyltransferase family 9 protein [Bryobacteraceae bacterium]